MTAARGESLPMRMGRSGAVSRLVRFGRRSIAAAALAPFQVEGYADYIALTAQVDVARGREALRANAFDMDPKRSGHYDRYRLLVGYLLQERRLSVDQL